MISDKNNVSNRPLKASVWFLICSFFQKAVAFVTTPIFTRIMTEEAYGQYAVYTSWFNIILAVVSLNFAAGVYTRGLVKNSEDQYAFSSSLLGLSTVCVGVGVGIYLLFTKQINDMLGMSTFLMLMMFAEIFTSTVFQFWSNKERANYRYVKLVIITALYVVLRPALAVVMILNAQADEQVNARVLATVVVSAVLFTALYVRMMIKGKRFFHKEYWVYALKFNIPLLPHYLSQIILNQSDKIMIDKMCGPADAAYYSVAYAIAMVLLVLNSAINSTMNPWLYRAIKEERYERIGKISYAVLAIIALSNVFVVASGPELLAIMAPESYRSALWIIPPLTVSVYFVFLYNLFATFEYYYEKTHYVTIASVIGAVLNLILNYIFIKAFGFIAAGYTTLVCYVVFVMMHYVFMRVVQKKFMGGKRVYDLRIIMLLGIALLATSAIMMMLYDYFIARAAIVFVAFVIIFIFRKRIIGIIKSVRSVN